MKKDKHGNRCRQAYQEVKNNRFSENFAYILKG